MNRGWTPESHVAITDAGMIIKIKQMKQQQKSRNSRFGSWF
jgi:hypothetical protein